jgi:hypothetical protein
MSESPRNGNPLDTDSVKFIFDHVPEEIPEGWVLAHNRVYAQWDDQPPGLKGFLAWFHAKDALAQIPSKAEAGIASAEPCDCGWSGLPHLRCALGIGGGPAPNVRGNKMSGIVERQDQQRRDAGARPKGSAVAGCRCCCILRTTAGWARLAYPATRWPTLPRRDEAALHGIATTIEPGGW